MSHPGIRETTRLLISKFIWTNINKDIQTWTKSCIGCQSSKITKHSKAPIHRFPNDTERFSVVHIDLIGPLPTSQDYRYCLTCRDRYTNWMEAIPIRDQSAETVAQSFFDGWICRFGSPHQVVTGQGKQFRCELVRALTKLCGSNLTQTVAYHPQSNGKIERFHRTLKAAIMSHSTKNWTTVLSIILLGLRCSLHEEANASISELVYGTTLRIPGDFFAEPYTKPNPDLPTLISQLRAVFNNLSPLQASQKVSRNEKVFVHKDLSSASHVFVRVDRVRMSLERPYEGPYKVQNRNAKYFTLLIKDKSVNISIDRLKPAYILADHTESPSVTPTTPTQHPQDNTTPPVQQPDSTSCTTTRAGRKVRFPARYVQDLDRLGH